ncbi:MULTISPECIES: alkaline phosphatase [unclassified Halomonas]|uniref:alkaline phosphatase n=1 Tax=unclassified Halomonas TaxID=2609666 RepID=UPI0020A1FF20|nr:MULTISPECIES: alkaline phosphatase [unclassified Halomonas]MCP1314251.1 alkaline phosphatase [Halomonas sp. 707D7]MCP1325712.1 alkaline phosphatase [Halomonas sp. 707D4]
MFRLLIAALSLNVLLVAPLWWRNGDLGVPMIALEAWVLAPLLLLVPGGRLRRLLVGLVMLLAGLVSAANLGDAATHTAFGRSLNLYLDLPLLRSVHDLLVCNVGQLAGVFIMALAGLSMFAALVFVATLLCPRRACSPRRLPGQFAVVLAIGALTLAVLEYSGHRVLAKSALPMVDTLRFQVEQVMATHRARQSFEKQLAQSPLEARALSGLEGRNVLITFIESYGVSAIDDPRYRDLLRDTLAEMDERLAARGIGVVSGLLEAPMRGGQSWLAHATVLSGRWIDNQLWYRLMLDSNRATLVDDFRVTGQRSLAVMPAITLAWPEGIAYGFDEIRAARDIPYAGPRLNWVTMPDQFTLDYVLRQHLDGPPLFAQITLISSHAPWTPILPVLENWSMIGNGAIYAPWENASDPPEVLWQDLERIRDHYGWSVDYSVKVTGRFAERAVGDDTLLIVLGDHQAAPLITGEGASAAVPVHVMSRDPALLDAFRARGFVDGTLPRLDRLDDVPRMSELRHWLREDFGAMND